MLNKSESQRKVFHPNTKKLEKQGMYIEWDNESNDLKLPKKGKRLFKFSKPT